ncbi:relaxase domain-containing protein [Streptomyces sp. NPDC059578]|uniref:relaxase domain-containing protein n=1 Tax=Streptomyces sp. NPDC059578 TaxID=3346874 RepID=UPI00369675F5
MLWALGDAHTRRVIERAHERAIAAALRWLEDEVAETRWSSGRQRAKAVGDRSAGWGTEVTALAPGMRPAARPRSRAGEATAQLLHLPFPTRSHRERHGKAGILPCGGSG